ncbi:hypothetical protein C5167_018058 [Papaver somniferum]|uniref:RRM domain-containing protein n=1 Tax=Papaver somniferum TaxID=3469 RepID=A0A4Y7INF4_PAPSO|nr:hypothetical protein C5167_018058 [Papaver somniferum]
MADPYWRFPNGAPPERGSCRGLGSATKLRRSLQLLWQWSGILEIRLWSCVLLSFSDAKCALTAMDALQGYRFDIKNPEAQTLNIQFAQFPSKLPPALSQESPGEQRDEH